MKKEYVSPAIFTMRVETVSMIAASLGKGEETLGDADYEKYHVSRETGSGNLWDDED